MSLILIPLVLLAVLAGAWLLWRSRSAVQPGAAAPASRLAPVRPLRVPLPAAPAMPPAATRPDPAATPGGAAVPAPLPALPPEALGSFHWQLAEQLPETRRQALTSAVASIRRPPAALHQLLSPQFLDRASSQALSELINGEAQIAAKVLATVNAPAYGLQRPVSSIGQAVTFLGLNTVRSICLRDLMGASFPLADPALKLACQQLWNASALASELCNRLSAKLGMADSGALVAQVLLSFLGHVAGTTLLATQAGAAMRPPSPGTSLLARTRAVQDALGLGAAEVGGLLLHSWGLPAAIVDQVRAIDRLLVTPPGALAGADGQRLAVAHLCARLGEQLAIGSAPASGGSLAGLAAALAEADDGFHLRQHLDHPALARLAEHLQAPDLVQPMLTLQQGMLAQR